MEIRKKLRAKAADILLAPDDTIARTLQNLSAKAILKGIGSTEWRTYMEQFTSDTTELARLNGEDDTFNQEYQKQNLAYVVANAICGAQTSTRTHLRVDEGIDFPGVMPNPPV